MPSSSSSTWSIVTWQSFFSTPSHLPPCAHFCTFTGSQCDVQLQYSWWSIRWIRSKLLNCQLQHNLRCLPVWQAVSNLSLPKDWKKVLWRKELASTEGMHSEMHHHVGAHDLRVRVNIKITNIIFLWQKDDGKYGGKEVEVGNGDKNEPTEW